MKNGPSVGDLARVYIDANIFIYAVEAEGEVAETSQAIIRLLENHAGVAVTSELTLAEVLARPEKLGNVLLKRAFLDLIVFREFVDLCPVSREILIDSARYRAVAKPSAPETVPDRRNFLPDAIHVVTAIQRGCSFFVANDTRIALPSHIESIRPNQQGIERLRSLFP